MTMATRRNVYDPFDEETVPGKRQGENVVQPAPQDVTGQPTPNYVSGPGAVATGSAPGWTYNGMGSNANGTGLWTTPEGKPYTVAGGQWYDPNNPSAGGTQPWVIEEMARNNPVTVSNGPPQLAAVRAAMGAVGDGSSANGSRLDQGESLIRDRMATYKDELLASLSEEMSRRGGVGGSSIYNQGLKDVGSKVEQAYNAGVFDLAGQERSFDLQQQAQNLSAELGRGNLDLARTNSDRDYEIRKLALQFQREGMDSDQAYRQAAFEYQKQQDATNLGWQREQFQTNTGMDKYRLRASLLAALEGMDLSAEDIQRIMAQFGL